MRATAIIGGGLGDEGKGLVTDYHAHKLIKEGESVINLRFNGGAQAAHTVVTPDGMSHVFGHFGSSSLIGVPTFLSHFFIVNPIIFFKEHRVLEKLCTPKVYVDPQCVVTTPYDMLINQYAEDFRNKNKHGSCGLGINETVTRHENLQLFVRDFFNEAELRKTLIKIRNEWVPKRVVELGMPYTDELKSKIDNVDLMEVFIGDCVLFTKYCEVRSIRDFPKDFDHVLFEGAQGLLLDEHHKWFPYVTRSKTGIHNAIELAEELGIREIDVVYVTRTYMTRHGAGPLPHELFDIPYLKVSDPTNIPNQFQDHMRFAYLDFDLLMDTIYADMNSVPMNIVAIKPSIMVTCVDQLDEGLISYYLDGKLCISYTDEFLQMFDNLKLPVLVSAGRTRQTVTSVEFEPVVEMPPSNQYIEVGANP